MPQPIPGTPTIGNPQDLVFYPCIGNPPIDAFLSDGVVFVDAQNGNNINRGLTAPTAVQRLEELSLRWGGGNFGSAGPGVGSNLGVFRDFQVATLVQIASLPAASICRVPAKPLAISTLSPAQLGGIVFLLPQSNANGQIPVGCVVEFADYSGAASQDAPIVILGQSGGTGFAIDGSYASIMITEPFGRVTLTFAPSEGPGSWVQVFRSSEAGINAEVAPAWGPTGKRERPIFSPNTSNIYLDPINGNDANNGQIATPIQTVAQFNRRIRGTDIAQAIQLNVLSDVPTTDEGLDLDDVRLINPSGGLTIVGVQVVIFNSPNPLTAGTQTINGATQTRQLLEDTTHNLTQYAAVGGTSGGGLRLTVKGGARNGNGGWIVSQNGGANTKVNATRPYSSASSPGPINAGDSYNITRGVRFPVSNIAPRAIGGQGVIAFHDCTLFSGPNAAFATMSAEDSLLFFNRVSCDITSTLVFNFDDMSGGSKGMVDCNIPVGFGPFSPVGTLTLTGGLFVTNGAEIMGRLNLNGDAYITGFGLLITGVLRQGVGSVSPIGTGALAVSNNIAGTLGAQFQDCTSTDGAIYCLGDNAFADNNHHGLLWGNGNTNFGIQVGINANVTVPSDATDRPTVTGTAGDFAFVQPGSPKVVAANAVIYTVAAGYALATTATTWANYANAASFNFHVHSPISGATLIGIP